VNAAPQSLTNETHATGLRFTLAIVAAIATGITCLNLSPAIWFVFFRASARPEATFFRLLTAGLSGGGLAALVAMIFVFRARSGHALALRFSACFFALAFAAGALGFALFAINTRPIEDNTLVGGWAVIFATLCFPLAGLLAFVSMTAGGVGVVMWAMRRSERRGGV
jgi:hypothetical protein